MHDPFAIPEERFVVRVAGDEARAFLHAMLTQDLTTLEPGRAAFACYLDEKGRVLAPMRVIATPSGEMLLEAEAPARAALIERLARVAPLSGCEIEPLPEQVHAIRGTAAALEHWAPLPAPDEVVARDGSLVVGVGEPLGGFDVIGDGPDVPVAGAEEWERARIDAGIPRFGVDVVEGALVNETPYLARAVSWTKGCYPGQESVARVQNLGRVRRRLTIVDTEGRVAPGSAVGSHGVVTSAADGIAMALLDATLEPGADVTIGDVAGRVRATL